VKKGESIALVGSSGGGKSSLVNLIPRFYDVSEGSILIDGVDLKDMQIKALRSSIAVVTQEVFLFNDTVKNNIALGRMDCTDEEIKEAAKAAYADGFINELPNGYDTNIGDRGINLSGGQRQRLSIARAILNNAPVLILDEATSSLDTESELEVQKAIDVLMKGRTTFVIAHRLSTIKNVDRILVLENGRIIEEGGHDELLSRESEYKRFYCLQYNA
jgi:subfamily B ATP-binding cassette protein MsbA